LDNFFPGVPGEKLKRSNTPKINPVLTEIKIISTLSGPSKSQSKRWTGGEGIAWGKNGLEV
jgi:hypothetical protein